MISEIWINFCGEMHCEGGMDVLWEMQLGTAGHVSHNGAATQSRRSTPFLAGNSSGIQSQPGDGLPLQLT